MSLPTLVWDTTGNFQAEDGVALSYDSMLNTAIKQTLRPAIVCGTGAPTFTAPQGSLYLRLDGSSASTRAYINTTGATTWTAVTTAA